ncbi:MAG: family 10 glycosylhydrolase [Ignavibacteriales bacterium]
MRLKIIFSLFYFASLAVIAQPANETRAVWIATNFRLDWPPPVYNEQTQKKALTDILDNLLQKNFNTVYFQVLFNGTSLYKSRLLPMSYYISGVTGDTNTYDPLAFAVDECHKRGLEIHAWINTLRCFTGTENFVRENPKHVMSLHKDWIVEKFIDGQTTYWLDAGLPQVRNYLIDISNELINNYDIDGLQFDFLRYPSTDFNDSKSFGLFGKKSDRDNWRRENINLIVKKVHELIEEEKPFVKFGVTPIGIYKNQSGAKGLQGFSDVYQDTKLWLSNGWIDYATPQIYWNFNDNPKFDIVANDWKENSFGRNIVLGIAAYKNDVVKEIDKMINYSRKINASGLAFFRYSNIKDVEIRSFSEKSFPAKMDWKDNEPPDEISTLTADVDEKNKVILSWNIPENSVNTSDIFYTAIYKLNSEKENPSPTNLLKLTKVTNKSIRFFIGNPANLKYYFALKTLDRFWNESLVRSNIVEVKIPALTETFEKFKEKHKPIFVRDENDNIIFVTYSFSKRLIQFQFENSTENQSANLLPGINLVKLEKKNIELNSIKVIYPE